MTDAHDLAPYACKPEESRGRLDSEPESATRTCFQRDRDRIIHTAAFRRLQVPVVGYGPIKSTEQLAPMLVFLAFQILEFVEVRRREQGLNMVRVFLLRAKIAAPVLLAAAGTSEPRTVRSSAASTMRLLSPGTSPRRAATNTSCTSPRQSRWRTRARDPWS